MELRGTSVAVTGATGFIGRYIVDVLLRRGAHVIGVVRNPARVPELAPRGVELRQADLDDRAALVRGFVGADAVVSNAALFALANRSWEEHQVTNVRGTENVFHALAEAHVRRVVHVSSVAVYRGYGAGVDEDAPQHTPETRRGLFNAYPVSKALSEQLAWRKAAELSLELTTVRPSTVYGAFDPNFTPLFRRVVGWPVTFVPVLFHLPLVYAGDVAEAIALALEHSVSIGHAYNVAGDAAFTVREFARAWREAGGPWRALLAMPLPVPLKMTYDNSRAARDLGWHNRAFVDALRETFALETLGRSIAAE